LVFQKQTFFGDAVHILAIYITITLEGKTNEAEFWIERPEGRAKDIARFASGMRFVSGCGVYICDWQGGGRIVGGSNAALPVGRELFNPRICAHMAKGVEVSGAAGCVSGGLCLFRNPA
jgi:transposase